MSSNDSTEFSTRGSLTIALEERSLRDARRELEDELGDLEVAVQAESGTRSGGGAASSAIDDLAQQGSANLDLDETRNDILREMEDLLEAIANNTQGGSGDDGGLFRRFRRFGNRGVRTTVGTTIGAATTVGLMQQAPSPGDSPTPGDSSTPSDVSGDLPIRLPTGVSAPEAATGPLQTAIAANQRQPDAAGQLLGQAGFLAATGGPVAAGTLGVGSGLLSAGGTATAGLFGGASLALPRLIAQDPLGRFERVSGLVDAVSSFAEQLGTRRVDRETAVRAAVQSSTQLSGTSLSTEAGIQGILGTTEIDAPSTRTGDRSAGAQSPGGIDAPNISGTSPGRDRSRVTFVRTELSDTGRVLIVAEAAGKTIRRPIDDPLWPDRIVEQARDALDSSGSESAGGGGDSRNTRDAIADDVANQVRDEISAEVRQQVKQEMSRQFSGETTTGVRTRPGSTRTRSSPPSDRFG